MILEKLKLKTLPQDVRHVLQVLGECAQAHEVSAWLVGGMVRDFSNHTRVVPT